jgi:Na+/H+ antiporter NhaD/arsenite permease-like protein
MKNNLNFQLNVKKVSQYLKKFLSLIIILSRYANKIAIKISTLIFPLIKQTSNYFISLRDRIYFYSYLSHSNFFIKFAFNIFFYFLFQLLFNFSMFQEVFASETETITTNDPDNLSNKKNILIGLGIILTVAIIGYLIWPETPTDIPDPEPFNAVDAVLSDVPPYMYPS